MKSNLRVIDASACVYTGMSSEVHRDRSYYGYPVGGLHYLFRYIVGALARKEDVIVAFDSRSFRKDLLDTYKAGRAHSKVVASQLEQAFSVLTEANLACYKVKPYEADDVINWAVQQNHGNYYDIEIYGNDKDLVHCVQPGVSFRSISSNVNSIYVSNFDYGIEKGVKIPFNTVAAYKVFCGCSSDRIPSFKLENGKGGLEVYQDYLGFLEENRIGSDYYLITNPKLLVFFGNLIGYFSPEDKKELLKRIRLVYPAECPEGLVVSPSTYKSVNKETLTWALSLFNDWESIKCLKCGKHSLSDVDVDRLRSLAKDLTSGSFEVDRNRQCEIEEMQVFEESVFLRDL